MFFLGFTGTYPLNGLESQSRMNLQRASMTPQIRSRVHWFKSKTKLSFERLKLSPSFKSGGPLGTVDWTIPPQNQILGFYNHNLGCILRVDCKELAGINVFGPTIRCYTVLIVDFALVRKWSVPKKYDHYADKYVLSIFARKISINLRNTLSNAHPLG